MPAAKCLFIEPQAGTRINLIANPPCGKKFFDQFLRNSPLLGLIDHMVDAEWRRADCPTTGATAVTGGQHGKISTHQISQVRMVNTTGYSCGIQEILLFSVLASKSFRLMVSVMP